MTERLGQRRNVIAVAAAAVTIYSLIVLVDLVTREQGAARRALEANQLRLERRLEETGALVGAATEARSRLLDGIVSAGENERRSIAAELHDGPVQLLAAIGFGLDRALRRLDNHDTIEASATIEAQRDQLTQAIGDLCRLIAELRRPRSA